MESDRDSYVCEGCGETIQAEPPVMAEHPADECPSGDLSRFIRSQDGE